MKTLEQVVRMQDEAKAELIRAVVENIGIDSVEDVNNHGIDGGSNGFIYTRDTVAFYQTHKAAIMEMLKEAADGMGEDVLQMIGGFRCLGYYDQKAGKWTDKEGQEAIGQTIYGGPVDDMVGNALAWFAAEEVCRMFED